MGRVMIERPAPAAGRDADIRTYPVKAGESVQAGDVVDVVGGAAVRTLESKTGSHYDVHSGQSGTNCICALTPTTGLIACATGSGDYLHALAYRINDAGVTFGDMLTINSKATGKVRLVKLTNTSVLLSLATTGCAAMVLTVNNLTITAGPSTSIMNPKGTAFDIVGLSATKVAHVILEYERVRLRVLTISGTSISVGSESAEISAYSALDICATRLPDLNGKQRIFICFGSSNVSAFENVGEAVIGAIASTGTVTWGTKVSLGTSRIQQGLTCCADGNTVIVAGINTNSKTEIKACSVNNLAINMGSTSLLFEGTTTSYLGTVNGKPIWVRYDGQLKSVAQIVHISGTAVSLGEPYGIYDSVIKYQNFSAVDDESFLVAGTPNNYSNPVRIWPMKVAGGVIGGEIVNASTQAIALASGTGGQSIDVIFDGTAELPGITAGTSITSPGVQGYSPQAGWLWVKPEWADELSQSAVLVKYIGSLDFSTAGVRDIDVGFKPSCAIIFYYSSESGDLSINDSIWFVPRATSLYDLSLTGKGVSINKKTTLSNNLTPNMNGIQYLLFAWR